MNEEQQGNEKQEQQIGVHIVTTQVTTQGEQQDSSMP